MTADLTPVFERYIKLRDDVDRIFASMRGRYPQCVACRPGCSDCCHALFDISLVEAMYINKAFAKAFDYGPKRSQILERASSLDRKLAKMKREMFRAEKDGESPEKIMEIAASARMACPLLDEDDKCLMYVDRPITCRLYGIPVDIGGKGYVCGFSNFDKGQDYPSVHMDKIQRRLEDMSAEIGSREGSKLDVADIYVPLSMALLTKYDDAYFGGGAGEEKA